MDPCLIDKGHHVNYVDFGYGKKEEEMRSGLILCMTGSLWLSLTGQAAGPRQKQTSEHPFSVRAAQVLRQGDDASIEDFFSVLVGHVMQRTNSVAAVRQGALEGLFKLVTLAVEQRPPVARFFAYGPNSKRPRATSSMVEVIHFAQTDHDLWLPLTQHFNALMDAIYERALTGVRASLRKTGALDLVRMESDLAPLVLLISSGYSEAIRSLAEAAEYEGDEQERQILKAFAKERLIQIAGSGSEPGARLSTLSPDQLRQIVAAVCQRHGLKF
jgi:hypothetical protein